MPLINRTTSDKDGILSYTNPRPKFFGLFKTPRSSTNKSPHSNRAIELRNLRIHGIITSVPAEKVRTSMAASIRKSSIEELLDRKENFNLERAARSKRGHASSVNRVETDMPTEIVNTKTHPIGDNAYRIMRLSFSTKKWYRDAVYAYYQDSNLSGYPIDTDDGKSLLVPKESIMQFKKTRIPFIVIE